ncbi:MAG: hydrogenase nickel incorporation protein HypB [Anaerolineales bacterium]|nr:hydrogenase nickel incorporation protein HypB [Anaerolineales bacterium]
MKIPVVKQILTGNDQIAAENEQTFRENGVFALNLMAAPGAGKTTFILATIDHLPADVRPAVIEGDLASTIDADTISQRGVPVIQINTGGGCHLDAPMVRNSLPHFALSDIDLLFIENVGNLVCPSNFKLGTALSVVVSSTAEGHDKPYKYPGIFATADVVILTKADILEVFEFDREYFERGLKAVNQHAPLFVVSGRTGAGIDAWVAWLLDRRRGYTAAI